MVRELKSFQNSFLRSLLMSDKVWETLNIDYHEPFVNRLWMQMDEDYRIYLHEIHPCKEDEALLHPHSCQAAMHVLPIGGAYEHGVGYQKEDGEQIILGTQEVKGEMYYDILDKNAIHYVRPIMMPVYTVMLAGPQIWPENHIKPPKKLGPLSEEEKIRVLTIFRGFFNIDINKP